MLKVEKGNESPERIFTVHALAAKGKFPNDFDEARRIASAHIGLSSGTLAVNGYDFDVLLDAEKKSCKGNFPLLVSPLDNACN